MMTEQPHQAAPDGGTPTPGDPGLPPLPVPPGGHDVPRWGQYAPPLLPGMPYPAPGTGYPGAAYPGTDWAGYSVPPPQPGVIPLRPLGVGEILDGAFQAARQNAKAMFGSALFFQLLAALFGLLIMVVGFGRAGMNLLNGDLGVEFTSDADLRGLFSTGLAVMAALAGVGLVTGLVQLVVQGTLVIPVMRATLNQRTGFALLWRLARGRVAALLLLALLFAGAGVVAVALLGALLAGLVWVVGGTDGGEGTLLAVALGLLLSLPWAAVGLWVGVKLLLAPAVVVVERLGPVAALKRSWQLTDKHWWRSFGITALAALIATALTAIVTTPVNVFVSLLLPVLSINEEGEQWWAASLLAQLLSALVSAVVGAVALAFQSAVLALLYVDLRMRRDGLAEALLREAAEGPDDGGIPGRPTPPPPAPQDWPQS